MISRFAGALILAMFLLCAGVDVSGASDAKSLQFSGTVTAVDGKARTITVRNGNDTRVFSTDGLGNLKVKKGERVSVDYRLAAWKDKRK